MYFNVLWSQLSVSCRKCSLRSFKVNFMTGKLLNTSFIKTCNSCNSFIMLLIHHPRTYIRISSLNREATKQELHRQHHHPQLDQLVQLSPTFRPRLPPSRRTLPLTTQRPRSWLHSRRWTVTFTPLFQTHALSRSRVILSLKVTKSQLKAMFWDLNAYPYRLWKGFCCFYVHKSKKVTLVKVTSVYVKCIDT